MARTRQSVERELAQQRASLNRIEEKIAIYTELEAPVHLLNQRDQIRDRIAQLEEWLRTGQLPEEAEGMASYPSMAAFAPAAVLSLLIIALSVDLIRRLVMVKPGLVEWSTVIALALLSLLVVVSVLILTGRRAFLQETKQTGRIRALIGVAALWLIALSVAWFMRPALAKFYNNRGASAHQARVVDKAKSNYLRALSWNPDDTVALFNLGMIYEETGECEKSVGRYEKAMESDPAFAPAYNHMARLYLSELCPEVQDPKRASTLLEAARKRWQEQDVSPEFSTEVNYAIAKNLGWAYLAEGRYTDAGRELQEAIKLVEDRAAAHCLLAQVSEKTAPDDKDATLREWRDCLAFGPDTTLYEENLWASMARERLGGQ